MERRSFLKLAAASPALVGPAYAGGSAGTTEGRASGTVIGSQSLDPQTGFTFHSPLAEAWYRSGEYFEWTSTTPNNEGRRVRVFYRTFGNRANPALVILHGYPTSSFDFREMIPFLEEDYFVAVLDFPGFGFSGKPQDGYSYMLEDDAKLVDHFVREIVGLSRFNLLTHDRGGSVGFAFLGNYLAREEKAYEITYHFISNGGLFLPLANLSQGQYDIQHPVRGAELIREQQARPRVTEGTPQQVAYADIQAFNDGIGARLYVGKYLLERTANEYRWLDNLRESPIPTALIWGLLDTVNPPASAITSGTTTSTRGRWKAATGCCRPPITTCNGTSLERWRGSSAPVWRWGSRRRRTRTRSCGPWLGTGPRPHPSTWAAPSSRASTFRGPSRTRRTGTVSEGEVRLQHRHN